MVLVKPCFVSIYYFSSLLPFFSSVNQLSSPSNPLLSWFDCNHTTLIQQCFVWVNTYFPFLYSLQISDEQCIVFLGIVYVWLIFLFCPVCRIVSCRSRSVSASKKRPGCWRVSSILTLCASMTPGRDHAKERNVLFWLLSSWRLARLKREYTRDKVN